MSCRTSSESFHREPEGGKALPGKASTLSLFLSFLKIGLIGFGGGSAFIPVVERELVKNRKYMDSDNYIKHTIITNITPGTQPVKLGATCGNQLGGLSGSLASAYAVSIPGVLMTALLLMFISVLGPEGLRMIEYASVGVTVFILFILDEFIVKTVQNGPLKVNLLLLAAAFILTGGSELRSLAAVFLPQIQDFGIPLFDISTFCLMLITFYLILFIQASPKSYLPGGMLLCILFAFLMGKTGAAAGLRYAGKYLLTGMLFLLLLLYHRNGYPDAAGSRKLTIPRNAVVLAGLHLLVPALSLFICLLLGIQGTTDYAANVVFSTITSFGGGAAYLSVADGVFVQSGYLSPELFYSNLVPIANALPGPLLVKIASGAGFLHAASGGMAAALAFAAAGMCCSVGSCCALTVLVSSIYTSVADTGFVKSLRLYILPVICGMLISTMCSMLVEAMRIMETRSFPAPVSFPILVGGVLLLHLLARKTKLPDLLLIAASAGISLLLITL